MKPCIVLELCCGTHMSLCRTLRCAVETGALRSTSRSGEGWRTHEYAIASHGRASRYNSSPRRHAARKRVACRRAAPVGRREDSPRPRRRPLSRVVARGAVDLLVESHRDARAAVDRQRRRARRAGLYDAVVGLPWEEWLTAQTTFAVEATLRSSEHRHSASCRSRSRMPLSIACATSFRCAPQCRYARSDCAGRRSPCRRTTDAVARSVRRTVVPARLSYRNGAGADEGNLGCRDRARRRVHRRMRCCSIPCVALAPS